MKNPKQQSIEDAWYSCEDIEGVKFHLIDSVEVIEGEHNGKIGAVISLLPLKGIPEYLVELNTTGADAIISENYLNLLR